VCSKTFTGTGREGLLKRVPSNVPNRSIQLHLGFLIEEVINSSLNAQSTYLLMMRSTIVGYAPMCWSFVVLKPLYTHVP
jgi:hypothetical protein